MRFRPINVISAGSKSEVHRCIDRSDDDGHRKSRMVAIKLMGSKEHAYEEINKLLLVGHRHIVPILDIVEDRGFVGIVMPCVQMDLRSFMGSVKYSAPVMLQIKLQTMAAVHHIHTRGILHLDIKPENICVDIIAEQEDGGWGVHCILLDFGSSVVTEELLQRWRTRRSSSSSSATMEGDEASLPITIQTTQGYHSPELKLRGILSSACDIYSAGVVFGELVDHHHHHPHRPSAPTTYSTTSTSDSSLPFRQLSLDMQHGDFRCRPSSMEVLHRLGDEHIRQPLMLIRGASAGPAWTSPIASTLIAQSGAAPGRRPSAADAFINDRQSTDLQKLVTLVRSADVGHIRDAFWLLFETSVEEVDGLGSGGGGGLASVLSILHYFESRVYLAKEHGFFYAKSLDILSRLPYFVLTDDMKLHLWKLSSASHACERPVLRCLANCWASSPGLAAWCADERKRWGVRQEAFAAFAARFADDWDAPCAEAVRRVVGCA